VKAKVKKRAKLSSPTEFSRSENEDEEEIYLFAYCQPPNVKKTPNKKRLRGKKLF